MYIQVVSGNYVDKLIAYYDPERVYGVQVRTALSNGDYNAHFNDGDSTVVLDKLTQNEIMMGNMRRGDIHFWKNSQRDPRVITFIKHWQNVVIRTEDREDNQTHLLKHVKVITRKGGDQQRFPYIENNIIKSISKRAKQLVRKS